jgi:hypothetical protein
MGGGEKEKGEVGGEGGEKEKRGGGGELNYHVQLMGNYFLFTEYSLDSEQMQPFCNIGKYCTCKQVHRSQHTAAEHTNRNLEMTFRFL